MDGLLKIYLQELDALFRKIKRDYPYLSVYAHIGDPRQETLDLEGDE